MTENDSIRKGITSFHYVHAQTYQTKNTSLCPSAWYRLVKVSPLVHGLTNTEQWSITIWKECFLAGGNICGVLAAYFRRTE